MNSLHHQAAGYTDNGEPFIEHHPADDLEPVALASDELRDARLRYLEIINAWGGMMHRALLYDDNPASLAIAFFGAAFAMALPCLNGASMTEIAQRFNISRAAISKAAVRFAEAHTLPSSRYLKCESCRSTFSLSRIAQVKQSSNGNGHV